MIRLKIYEPLRYGKSDSDEKTGYILKQRVNNNFKNAVHDVKDVMPIKYIHVNERYIKTVFSGAGEYVKRDDFNPYIVVMDDGTKYLTDYQSINNIIPEEMPDTIQVGEVEKIKVNILL